MAEIKLDDANFEETVLKTNDVFLVDFWAPWCGPCMRIAPIIADIAKENEGKIKVGKVNTDEAPATAARFQISSIPTLIIFKGGKPYEQIVGLRTKTDIQSKIDQTLAS